MAAPRVFWFSASVAALVVAASASYYLLVILPSAQRRREDRAAEIASKEAKDKQAADCAEQARRTGQDMGKYSTFGPPLNVSGVTNHYNRKLSKCIADVETVNKDGTSEMVLDAYEQSSIFLCTITFVPKAVPPTRRMCLDSQGKSIDPDEAEKQIDALMRE